MAQMPNIMKKLDLLTEEVKQIRVRQSVLATEAAIQEMMERKHRATNIIIFDVPDVTRNVDCNGIKTFRLGALKENTAGPRPLKVVLKSKADAIQVLKNKGKLPNAKKIKSDLTPLQLKPTLIVVTETWLKPNIPDCLIRIPNYNNIYRDDRINKRSGGVAIYVANTNGLTTKLNSSLNVKLDATECLWIDITLGKNKFVLCGLYRGLDSTLDQDNILFQQISTASDVNTVLVMEDFNYRGVKWPLEDCAYLTPIEVNFVQWYLNSNLQQLVTEHTRFRQGNQPSFLDLVLSNEETLVAKVDHQAPIGKSDHNCIVVTIQLENHQSSKSTASLKWNYKKADFDKINEDLSTLPAKVNIYNCVKDQYNNLMSAFEKTRKLNVPQIKNIQFTSNKPWIGKELQDMIKEKHIQWNRYVLTGLDSVHEKYRKINNKIINKCRNKRINYETNLLKEGPKKFNSYIRQQVTSKVSIPTVLHNNQGQTVTFAKDIAEAFADQFEGVFEMEPSGPLPILDPSLRIEPSITELTFTSTKVEQAIKELKQTHRLDQTKFLQYYFRNVN
ncbi:endonuclease-reverse transcriptase domain-containing protein [Phthorimaea operculella]|nr:endonuclease-reverse transcriptase domain-containing protein [Phthorimaea operculella]